MRTLFASTLLASAVYCGLATAAEPLPLIFTDDFEHGIDRWETTDPDRNKPFWELTHPDAKFGNGTQALRVLGPSDYQPPYRSPHSMARVKDLVVGDFQLDVHTQSTNADAGPHRDMCVFWGYQDPAHFYYVHLGAKADPHACQIFVVDDAPRVAITKKTVEGTPWQLGWHKIRVVRRVDDGVMEVYFDDMDQPHMTAVDKRFTWGKVGLGTFDDNGNWDNFQLRGTIASPSQ